MTRHSTRFTHRRTRTNVWVASLAAGAIGLILAQAAAAGVDKAKAEKLANDRGCLACHNINKKVIGPAYKDVTKKYKGNPGAEAVLVKKVINGGGGVWGPIPMPPNKGKLTDAEAKTLVEWILSM